MQTPRFAMKTACLLLVSTLLFSIQSIDGAAVLDLINLFHQYEDDILGRGQGVNPEPLEINAEVDAGNYYSIALTI